MSPSFVCSTCGQVHKNVPLSWGPDAPAAWAAMPPEIRDKRGELGTDQCVIDGERFFIRGRIEIPVVDTKEIFAWLVWAEVDQSDFMKMGELWTTPGREKNSPIYGGRIANELSIYPSPTLGVSINLHTRPVGHRPFFEVMADHSIGKEQRNGISSHRVQEIADILSRPGTT
jgi:hypothetical protein